MNKGVFTKAERSLLEERLKGERKDPHGLFANRIKPKVCELLSVWFPRKKELEKVIGK